MSLVKYVGEVIVEMIVDWNGSNYIDTSGSSDESSNSKDDASSDR